jgi:hypothetical protein
LSESDLNNAANEGELREKAAIPGVPLEYLRFVRSEGGQWSPAAGTFDSWPREISGLKLMDPCCGSGHFLVAALRMLVPMRMELEGVSARDAVDSVLLDNIHGLELDRRCVEIAPFALALAAWTISGTGDYRVLPKINVACSGLSVSSKEVDWLSLSGEDDKLKFSLSNLYKQFSDAPILGSLIDPEYRKGDGTLFGSGLQDVRSLLSKALSLEVPGEMSEITVAAHGAAEAANLLAGRYTLVITNVPYLTGKKQSKILSLYCKDNYPNSKNDLATVFMERSLKLCDDGATLAVVSPQSWMFLSRYRKFRVTLLKDFNWNLVADRLYCPKTAQ